MHYISLSHRPWWIPAWGDFISRAGREAKRPATHKE